MIPSRIVNQIDKVTQRWRLIRATQRGAVIGRDCHLGGAVGINLGVREGRLGVITIEELGWIEQGAILWAFGGRIQIGRSVFLGPYVVIYGHGGVEIGDETLVSMHCCILSSNHATPTREHVIRQQPDICLPTRIGCDVWLGAGVRVLGGVTIGDGCVVGAGAVVTKNLPPYSIAVGVPATVIARRG